MPVVHPDHPHLGTLRLNHQEMTKGHPPRIDERLFQAAGDDIPGRRIAPLAQRLRDLLRRLFIGATLKEEDIGRLLGRMLEDEIKGGEEIKEIKGEAGRGRRIAVAGSEMIIAPPLTDRPAETGEEALEGNAAVVIEAAQFAEVKGDVFFEALGLKDSQDLAEIGQRQTGTFIMHGRRGLFEDFAAAEEARQDEDLGAHRRR